LVIKIGIIGYGKHAGTIMGLLKKNLYLPIHWTNGSGKVCF